MDPTPSTTDADHLAGVYRERNALALLVAWLVDHTPHGGQIAVNTSEDPEWPILLIQSNDFGQISYHIPADEIPHRLFGKSLFGDAWDGHSTVEKYRRIDDFLMRMWGSRKTRVMAENSIALQCSVKGCERTVELPGGRITEASHGWTLEGPGAGWRCPTHAA